MIRIFVQLLLFGWIWIRNKYSVHLYLKQQLLWKWTWWLCVTLVGSVDVMQCLQVDENINRSHSTRCAGTAWETLRAHDGRIRPTPLCVWWSYWTDAAEWLALVCLCVHMHTHTLCHLQLAQVVPSSCKENLVWAGFFQAECPYCCPSSSVHSPQEAECVTVIQLTYRLYWS